MTDSTQITELLLQWKDGDRAAFENLLPLVETELRRIAHRYMRRERGSHTLQTTALINEAYLKLVDENKINWQNRAHFYGIGATVMRRILINYARDRQAEKRGGGAVHICIDNAAVLSPEKSEELLALDEALEKLHIFDELKSRIVEMRYFGGLTIQETAEVLQIAAPTVSLHWRMARAWLQTEIRGGEGSQKFKLKS